MTKIFNRFAWQVLAAVAAFIFIMPSVALAFTYTVSEYPTESGSSGPFGITAGPDGNIWVAERNSGNIVKMSTSGTILATYNVSGGSIFDIVQGSDGNLWFSDQNNNAIGKITPSGTITEHTIPTSSVEPQRLALGADGNVWFTELVGGKVGKITPSGTMAEYSPPGGGGFAQFDGITEGSDGNIWAVDVMSSTIYKISTSGTFTAVNPSQSITPNVITAGAGGTLWMNDFNTNKIAKMTTSGTVTLYTINSTFSQFYDITEGPDGNVWYADPGKELIGQVTPSGTAQTFAPLTSSSGVSGITSGPDGNIWFTEQTVGQVGRILSPHAPIVANASYSVVQNQSKTINVVSGISGNPNPATLTLVSAPSHGIASLNTSSGTVTYSPSTGYVGNDQLTYQICSNDNAALCTQATLSFTVTLDPGVASVTAPDTGFGQPINDLSFVSLAAVSAISLGLGLALSYKYGIKPNQRV
jgi:virginiamycin B lyase